MKKRLSGGIIAVIVIAVLIRSNITFNASTIKDALNKANIQDVQVLESLETESGQVVFFSSHDNLQVALLKKGFLGWKMVDAGGGASFSDQSGLGWSFTNLESNSSNPIHLFLGTITNPRINQIEVQASTGSLKRATITETPKGRISYIFYEQAQNPPAKITGLSEDGNKIYEN